MSLASFDELRITLCEVAGVQCPDAGEDDQGISAFTIELDGVPTSLLHRREARDTFVVATRLGRVAESDELKASRMLMESNFLMIGEPATPCVGRNSITGDFVLHFTYRLSEATGVDVYQLIIRMTELAGAWRDHLAFDSDKATGSFADSPVFA